MREYFYECVILQIFLSHAVFQKSHITQSASENCQLYYYLFIYCLVTMFVLQPHNIKITQCEIVRISLHTQEFFTQI